MPSRRSPSRPTAADGSKGTPGKSRAKPKKKEEETQTPSEYRIAEGQMEVLAVWGELDKEEKKEVLSLSPEELVEIVRPDIVTQILASSDDMKSIRFAFVTAMQHQGTITISADTPVLTAIIQILDGHLVKMHARKTMMYKLFLFVVFVIYYSSYHWFWRLLALSIAWSVAVLPIAGVKRFREGCMLPFEDTTQHRSSVRMFSLISGVICVTNGGWLSWYRVMVVLVLLPLGLVELERLIGSDMDQAAMRYVTSGGLCISQAVAVYLNWYSWLAGTYVLFLSFPNMACLAVAGSGFVIALALQGLIFAQKLLGGLLIMGAITLTGLSIKVVWALYAVLSLVLLHTAWASTLWLCLALFFSACVSVPHSLTELVSLLVQKIGSAVISDYFIGAILNQGAAFLLNGAILVILLFVGLVMKIWEKLGCVCCKCCGAKKTDKAASEQD